ncbi:RraA family protein [Nonomuraea sp. M3C6]|uniref:Putative 4-hydroxy-4-methyl-2-oxoglutarate aldolase n=1 Tax=Nonomuraea marmarensis TaxID=3351344 RepID=A0ABW7ASM8_9ACTN
MTIHLEPTVAEQIRQRYLQVDTSNVADVLDELDLPDQGLAPAFAPYPSGAGKLAGWAHPILGEMREYPLGDRDPDKMKACAELTPGSVSVWAGPGEGVCFFGELIAIGMKERGSVGALVDGGVRDVAWIGQLGYPVYARYRTPVQSIGRWKVVDSGVPVTMPGATTATVEVRPGDFILADEDGAIAIPAAAVEHVLKRAEELGGVEVEIRRELGAGLTLANALAKFGHV